MELDWLYWNYYLGLLSWKLASSLHPSSKQQKLLFLALPSSYIARHSSSLFLVSSVRMAFTHACLLACFQLAHRHTW